VDGRRALFAGRYPKHDREGHIVAGSQEHQRLYLLTLNTGTVEVLEPRTEHGQRLEFEYRRSFGRGSCLYLRTEREVYRIDLNDLPETEVPA
jgi:hypothetical protein